MSASADHPRLKHGDVHVWIGASPEQVLPAYVERAEVDIDPGGKPRLADSSSGVTFSKSDTGELTVVALTRDRGIGVDVERIDDGRKTEAIAERLFSDREQAQLEHGDPAQRTRRFYEIWTAKEARAKATGRGLPQLLAGGERDFEIIELELPSGYAGSVAIERAESDSDSRAVIYSRLDG